MWVEFVFGSRPFSRGFSPATPAFPSPQKPTFPNSNSVWIQRGKNHLVDVPLIIHIYLFYSLIYYLVLSWKHSRSGGEGLWGTVGAQLIKKSHVN